MTTPESDVQWFIARDGKQHGPLSELEMKTFVSHNYLRAEDLIWRPGFSNWEPATTVFPAVFGLAGAPYAPPEEAPAPAPAPVDTGGSGPFPQRAASPQPQPTYEVNLYPPHEDIILPPERARSGTGKKLAIAAALVALLGGGAYIYATQRDQVTALTAGSGSASEPPVIKAEDTPPSSNAPAPAAPAPDARSAAQTETAALTPPPPPGASTIGMTSDELDVKLQAIPLWVLLKREFPEWYSGQITAAPTVSGEGGPEIVLARHLAEGLVALRRKNAEKALASSAETLKRIASAFLENLKALQSQSVNACFGFIAKGETSPAVLDIMREPERATTLNSQAAAIFEAIAEGTKSPVTHERAGRSDYDMLIQELNKIGWKDEDLQTFSNPKALATRPPERVCQMVQDWFTAHLAVPDPGVQERLLVETLRPVVSG